MHRDLDDGDDDLASAGALRAAWRAEEAEWSRAALERWQHEQTLVDVLRECMHRGDTVAVRFAAHTFTGVVTVGRRRHRSRRRAGRCVDVRVDARCPPSSASCVGAAAAVPGATRR